jgi:hypothetical protein
MVNRITIYVRIHYKALGIVSNEEDELKSAFSAIILQLHFIQITV